MFIICDQMTTLNLLIIAWFPVTTEVYLLIWMVHGIFLIIIEKVDCRWFCICKIFYPVQDFEVSYHSQTEEFQFSDICIVQVAAAGCIWNKMRKVSFIVKTFKSAGKFKCWIPSFFGLESNVEPVLGRWCKTWFNVTD